MPKKYCTPLHHTTYTYTVHHIYIILHISSQLIQSFVWKNEFNLHKSSMPVVQPGSCYQPHPRWSPGKIEIAQPSLEVSNCFLLPWPSIFLRGVTPSAAQSPGRFGQFGCNGDLELSKRCHRLNKSQQINSHASIIMPFSNKKMANSYTISHKIALLRIYRCYLVSFGYLATTRRPHLDLLTHHVDPSVVWGIQLDATLLVERAQMLPAISRRLVGSKIVEKGRLVGHVT